MLSTSTNTFEMTLDLSVLKHLGLNLYSNLPAVISEVVANAWDADATEVAITIDADAGRITLVDNGIGMTETEINERYLKVGYSRREDLNNPVGKTTASGRPVMGRKGIGKLSLFSIANTVTVHSVAPRPLPPLPGDEEAVTKWWAELETRTPVVAAFQMSLDAINDILEDPTRNTYFPKSIPPEIENLEHGTRIVLTDPRKNLKLATLHLRRRLARRFAIKSGFTISIDTHPIIATDREYEKRAHYRSYSAGRERWW